MSGVGNWSNKEMRKLAVEAKSLGGAVSRTSNGRLRVQGPAGVAVVGHNAAGRGMANAIQLVRTRAGLDIKTRLQ